MGADGLVPKFLVFGMLGTFPITARELRSQHVGLAAFRTAREETANLVAAQPISSALSSHLPPLHVT